jgi:hypothetical protein
MPKKIISRKAPASNGDEGNETLVVLVEAKNVRDLPGSAENARAIRTRCYIKPQMIVLLPPRTIAKTTSGKIARSVTRLRWLNGDLAAIDIHASAAERKPPRVGSGLRERFQDVTDR